MNYCETEDGLFPVALDFRQCFNMFADDTYFPSLKKSHLTR